MKNTKKISLDLNKQVIDQLDKHQAKDVLGGLYAEEAGSKKTNPNKPCCAGEGTVSGACISIQSFHCTEMPGC